jgi:hypothetical protein
MVLNLKIQKTIIKIKHNELAYFSRDLPIITKYDKIN